ncbi:hypothetical protein GGF37_000269 [Kickxella alabastrina]|nr:hypothetical protein GGF37_000269 [Kickxella alabastrina]
MEPTTIQFADQYLEAGGVPFNIMNLLISSYEGTAAMANMVDRDIMGAYGAEGKTAILETVSRKIVEAFDTAKADAEYEQTQQLPGYIEDMIPHQIWRKTIYRLSEKHPKSAMVSAALQRIADEGYQAEMTSLNSATLHTHVFYPMLVECLEKLASADDGNIKEHMDELIKTACRSEHTYFIAQYVLAQVRQKLGAAAEPVKRIENELETFMLNEYNRPQLAVYFRLLLEGLLLNGDDRVAGAVTSIIQASYASPGDVMILYKMYHGAFVSRAEPPPLHVLRSDRVLVPIINQTFGHLWSITAQNDRADLMDKHMWLIACATLCTDDNYKQIGEVQLNSLVAHMKTLRETLPVRPIQTTFCRNIRRILEWIDTPVLARVIVLWIKDILTYDNYAYFSTYFDGNEAPVPLVMLEEIAHRHPLLKPLVFDVYKDTFESKVPSFMLEKQIRLQKVAIRHMCVLAKLNFAVPVIRYFSQKAEVIDESTLVYFIQRMLLQFEPPYPEEFAAPMVLLIECVINAIKTAREADRAVIRNFLASVDTTLARNLQQMIPEGSGSPTDIAI